MNVRAGLRVVLPSLRRGYSVDANLTPYRLTDQCTLIRPTTGVQGTDIADDFILYPHFYSLQECRQLLAMALWKLDRIDSKRKRRRKGSAAGPGGTVSEGVDLQDMFEGEYGFEEGHYDSVIHHYRETLLSSLPPSSPSHPDLPALMSRLYSLLPLQPPHPPLHGPYAPPYTPPMTQIPPPNTSTHLLHLAPHGQILPHVDNLQASGSVIIGTSLGADRVLRLRRKGNVDEGWDVRLPNGSVYLQKDRIRYEYDHSILPYEGPESTWNAEQLRPGHRISIMVRDAASQAATL